MYQVYCNTYMLHNDETDDFRIYDAKIDKELGKSGSFEFVIFPDHPYYDQVVPLLSYIKVMRNHWTIYSGRVLNIKYGFYNEKQVSCEGELAFLLDSIIKPYDYTGSFSGYFEWLIDQHNAQVEPEKQFVVGNMTVGDFTPYIVQETEYRNALDTLTVNMVERSGGYLSVRNENGVRYLDLLSYNADSTATWQMVEFGANLLDVTRETNSEDVFSCIIPLGAKIEGTEKRVDISAVNDGKLHIENASAVSLYGKIYRVVIFEEITVPATLLTEATKYLAENFAGITTVELSAVDLSTNDNAFETFEVGKWVHLHDAVHFSALVQTFLIRKLHVDLHNPANTKITIGKTQKGITDSIVANEAESAASATGVSDAQQPYLLESGTTGIWTWKKFSDGTCEFFGKIPVTSEQTGTALGNWYRSGIIYEATDYPYPFELLEAPALQMMFQTRNANGALLWVFSDSAENARVYLPQCYLLKPTQTTGIHGNINIIGKGKI